MKYDFADYEKKLKKYLDKDRYRHTIGVMYTASALAMAHGSDIEKAQAAGLLHDCAKCIPNKKKLKLCKKKGLELSNTEKANPFLIHAKLGVYIAKEKYGIEDMEVLSSIRWHTTGKENMSVLEKIIYIADYIEPGRNRAPRLSWIRKVAFMDLDECMYYILKDSLAYLDTSARIVDPATEKAFRFYRSLHLQKKKRRQTSMNSKEMVKLACGAMEEKKAQDIKIIDIEKVSTLADYFIIASGSNRNQVQAMADNVNEILGRAGVEPKQIEGYQSANWILLDYRDIVIHIFDEENRLFYDLERIWRDGSLIDREEFR